jgi:hypothetical protein
MNNKTLVRGLFLAAISLLFGANALRYNLGTFSRAGAGMFPFIVSLLLLLIAIITIARSRITAPVPLDINLKNIALILTALCSFALVSKVLDMVLGIAAMVFIAAFAGRSAYSVIRNLKITAGLIAVAFAFQKLLGLGLRLF